jgi:hypothetical protein
MLFSSGDSPQSASSILSGEGFDEVQPGESPFVFPQHSAYLPRLALLMGNTNQENTRLSTDFPRISLYAGFL